MADARLGGAAFIASVNADKLVAGLNKAEGKIKEFGTKTKNIWEKIGERFGGGGGGFLAKSLGAGFFGGIAGSLAIRGMNAIADAVNNLISDSARWEAELARVQFRVEELAKQFDRVKKVRDEWTANTSGKDLESRLKEDVSRAQRMNEVARAAMETARNLNTNLNSVGGLNFHLFMRGDLRRSQAEAAQSLKNFESDAAKTGDALADAQEKLRRFDPMKDPAAQKALADRLKAAADFAKALRLEGKEAGMAAHELEALKKARELGVEGTMLGADIREAAFTKRFAELKAGAAEFTKSLKVQRVEMGLTANEAQLLQKRLEGMSREMLGSAATELSLMEQLDAARDSKPLFAGAMLEGSAEAHSLELRHRFQGDGAGGTKDVERAIREGNKKLDKVEKAIRDNKLNVLR